MKRILLISILSLFCTALLAQNQSDRNDAYKQFRQQREQAFQDWRAKANAEFTDYLAKAWEEFLVHTGKKDPIGELPDKPTYYGAETGDESGNSTHGLPIGETAAPASRPIMESVGRYLPAAGNVELDYFGIKSTIPVADGMLLTPLKSNEKEVSEAWNKLSQTSFMPTVDALSAMRVKYCLNDWATYLLVKQYTEALYSDSKINERVVTQMFLLCQLKYKVRVGSAGDDLVLLLPFKEQIYQVSYISDDKSDLYIFGYRRIGTQTPLYTFTKDFSVAENSISLTFDKPMTLGGSDNYVKVKLPLWTKIYGEEVTVPINQPYISLTLEYPQSDLLIYHHSAVDSETAKVILRSVKYKILKAGLDEQKAVGYILNLVQNGFEYKTDYEMFGRPKPLFIEESLFYGANNCKDRVVIFSWLVKNILGLNTIMFGFPNHVACGVQFKSDVKGDSFMYKGGKYVMCDPTFINAPIGATMTKYKGTTPSFIEL